MMAFTWTTGLLLASTASSLILGAVVIVRNQYRNTHRAFAILAVNLALWSLGVLFVTLSHTLSAATFWVGVTFVVAAFLPATFYHFIGLFPKGRFEAFRGLLGAFYLAAVGFAAMSFSPWYATNITVQPGMPPEVIFGPVLRAYGVCVGLSMIFSAANLVNKRRTAAGIDRRQIDHVILGVFLSTSLASLTNILAPILKITTLLPYGPTFTVLMMLIFAYAMVRYNLLDIWVMFSRTTVYALTTGFVVLTFFVAVSVVHWTFSSGGRAAQLLPTVLAALVIALMLEPLKERVQWFVDRIVLKRHYDMKGLLARVSQKATQIVHLDELLRTVGEDIQRTVAVDNIRVMLVDKKDSSMLVIEYSNTPEEHGQKMNEYGLLLDYFRSDPEPLDLERLIHARPTAKRTRLAQGLAELNAYLCLPLKASSGLVGLLTLGQKMSRDIYTTDDLVVFTALAGPLATAIENARLYRKLQEANLHRARILSNMRGGVIAVDTERKISTVNQGAVELMGPMEIGQDMESLSLEVAQLLDRTLQQREGFRDLETLIHNANGEPLYILMSSSCLTDADGGILGAMVLIYDLTQLKRLEQGVQRTDRLWSLGILAAGMAHEIKNPLVSIKTMTQLLLSRYDDPEFRTTFTDIVPHEVERIDSIVSRLLDFARPKPAHFAPQNIRTVIGHVLALIENQSARHLIRIITDFPSEELEVYGDEQQLHQVFLNLLLNAIEAMKETEDGVLRIKAYLSHMPTRRDSQASSADQDSVTVAVSDSGCGIPQEILAHLFTPFYTTKEQGSGLGLSVIHGIITEHGGEVDVISNPDEGTTFFVSLPLASKIAAVGGST